MIGLIVKKLDLLLLKWLKRVIKSVDKLFNSWKPRPNYEFINANEIKEDRVPHKLLY